MPRFDSTGYVYCDNCPYTKTVTKCKFYIKENIDPDCDMEGRYYECPTEETYDDIMEFENLKEE